MKKRFLLLFCITFSLLKNADSQTTVVLQPGPEGKDAGLWSIMPDNNYGNTPKFVSSGWTHYGEPGINRGIIDFDLSAIPEGAEILDAKLNFYFVCLEPNYFGHTGENEAYFQLITEPWEEDSVTWNNQPSTTEDFQAYLPPSIDPYQDYTDLDVTELIQKLKSEPENYHGIMLRLLNEEPYRCLLFASSDYMDTVEFRPKLVVTYTIAPNYTVVIQPGPEEGKDAQLWTIMPNTNYGDIPKFDCAGWTHYGEPGVNRGIIDFDLSIIPENAQILEARLNFYFVCLEPNFFGHTGENDAYLQLITDPWEEDYVTWNEQPMTTEEYQVYLPPSTDPYQDYTDLDVTELIQKLKSEPENYHGIMLRLLNEDPYRCLLFASSDYMDTIEFRPKLEITYTYCQAPVAGFTYYIEDLSAFFQDSSLLADEYWWDFGDGYYSDLSNPWHTYDEAGFYEVCLVTWNNCGSDTICETISFLTEAISENYPATFSIYPNPASSNFTITTNLNDRADLAVLDLSGRVLISSVADFTFEDKMNINIDQIPPGIYLIRITSEKISITRKLIVSR
jgi:PKD repeat protein